MLLLLSDVLTNFRQISNNCFRTIVLKKIFFAKKKIKNFKKECQKIRK